MLSFGIGAPWYRWLTSTKKMEKDMHHDRVEQWWCVGLLTVGQLLLYIWSRESNNVEVDVEVGGKEKFLWYVHPVTYSELYKGGKQAQEMDLDDLVKKGELDGLVEDVTKIVHGREDVQNITQRLSKLNETISDMTKMLDLE